MNENVKKNKCKCPFCATEVEFAFCKSCAKEFVKCHMCGELVEKQVAVCAKCGWKM